MYGLSFDKVIMISVFFCFFVGTNLTFFPIHLAGMQGMPRKILDYPDYYSFYQVVSSLGSIISFIGFMLFNYLVVESIYSSRLLGVSSYNFHRPAFTVNVPPLPDSYTEEALNLGLH